jgi:monovalent cation:H+ antiporter-2, CPA2 family
VGGDGLAGHPQILLELGAVLVGLAILSRLAGRMGLSPIPLYLTAGLAFGQGGVLPLVTADRFISIGAEVGLILLLFMLGLEYTASDLVATLRRNMFTGVLDFVLNFTPGFIAGFVLGHGVVGGVVLGGVSYVSSSGIAAKLISDSGRGATPGARTVVGVLITEDLVMAIYLPILGALLVEGLSLGSFVPAAVGIGAVALAILLALKVDVGLSSRLFSKSDEALLLTILGLTILVAGAAEHFGISAAVAALLFGMMLAGPAAKGAHEVIAPLRDMFAALFFVFVGLSVDPALLIPMLGGAAILAVVGAATKFATGWFGARHFGVARTGAIRSGAVLIARGEFSIVIAGLATSAGIDPDLEAFAVAYVLLLAIAGPIAAKLAGIHSHEPAPTPAS